MRNQQFYAIGHVANDLEPFPHLGGGVSYSGVAAKKLGFNVDVVTKYSVDFTGINELKQRDISVYRLPNRDPNLDKVTTEFQNYEQGDRRWQIVSKRQEDITLADVPNFPAFTKDAIILVAPIVGEVSPDLFPLFTKIGRLVVTPQGYFRHIESDGKVTRSPWKDIQAFSHAEMIILSDEDITFDDTFSNKTLDDLVKACPIVVLTRGSKGLSIYEGARETRIKALVLEEKEIVDRIGTGDSCASAIVWHYANWSDIKEAGAFGVLYAGLKIMGIGGKERGMRSLPSYETVHSYVLSHKNETRMQDFFRENGITFVSLFPEGNHRSMERR